MKRADATTVAPESLSSYIQARFDEFSRSQKDVAQYIVDHLDDVAFQTAESGLREAEVFLEDIVSLGDFQGRAGLFGRTDDEPSFYTSGTWSDSTYHVVAETDLGSYEQPRYFIKNLTTVQGTAGALNMSGYGDNKGSGDVTIFRVTVRATGTSADSAEVSSPASGMGGS